MRKLILIISLFLSVLIAPNIFATEDTYGSSKSGKSNILLLPLDSRPCNTEYPTYNAAAMGKKMNIPTDLLDNYYKASKSEKLFDYLDSEYENNDTLIIYTNQLLQGGLINSRSPLAYDNLNWKLSRLNEFLTKAKADDKKVVLITVLPRVIPSQFTDLWVYKDQLMRYSMNFENPEERAKCAKEIPQEVLNKYTSLFMHNETIINAVLAMIDDNLVDFYLLGQDDSEAKSLSTYTFKKYYSRQSTKFKIQPGADELTSLVLARMAREESPGVETLNLVFSSDINLDTVSAFESVTNKQRIYDAMTFLDIQESKDSANIEFVHNSFSDYENSMKNLKSYQFMAYRGLLDLAYINKGDAGFLKDMELFKSLNSYSGWNTVGNAIGSELSNFVFYRTIAKTIKSHSTEDQEKMLEAYYKKKYIHLADDLIYQSKLRANLKSVLLANSENPNLIQDKGKAEAYLKKAFQSESLALNKSMEGTYSNFGLRFKIKNVGSEISLPWNRIFEARIRPQLEVEIIR